MNLAYGLQMQSKQSLLTWVAIKCAVLTIVLSIGMRECGWQIGGHASAYLLKRDRSGWMCGRHFRHCVSWEEYHAQLSLFRPDDIPEINPAYNVAPTQLAPIIRLRDESDDLELAFARWDLVPRWWKKPLSEKKFSTFNAKSEDVAEKPTFRAAFKDRPCLLPMSGYYEWTGKKGLKQAHAIAMRNRRWFCVAGL